MTTIVNEIARLQQKTSTELRKVYEDLFGEPTRSGNKAFLIKRIAWRMQAIAEGDLPERARRIRGRAAEIADDSALRLSPPPPPPPPPDADAVAPTPPPPPGDRRLPMPGALLRRIYKGRTILVTVLEDGFEYEDTVYKSLTAVARAVTGTHWNGYLFFGLKNGGRS